MSQGRKKTRRQQQWNIAENSRNSVRLKKISLLQYLENWAPFNFIFNYKQLRTNDTRNFITYNYRNWNAELRQLHVNTRATSFSRGLFNKFLSTFSVSNDPNIDTATKFLASTLCVLCSPLFLRYCLHFLIHIRPPIASLPLSSYPTRKKDFEIKSTNIWLFT